MRSSRYLSEQVKESYYQYQNLQCPCTFKSVESVNRIITRLLEPKIALVALITQPEKRVLNRYGSSARLH
ncbi:ogr/Delta-like zinc finger family protein [Sodalis sp. dw_96]|uniref:ogr/Delta-like zinc finger family protein n=1 Tax=Sodalis sp. dw_96 TaxID=2719794 RepID=UPI0031F62ADD